MSLSAKEVETAELKNKPYKLYDEKGLFIIIRPDKSKWWRFKYYFNGLEQSISLGTYPETRLKEARDRRDEARKLVQAGINPSESRRASKTEDEIPPTFKEVAVLWHEKMRHRWKTEQYAADVLAALEKYVFPTIGGLVIHDVSKTHILGIIDELENRDKVPTAKKVRQRIKEIFAFAVSRDIATDNPVAEIDLKSLKEPKKVRHHACIEKDDLPQLLHDVNEYYGDDLTRLALKLLFLTFVRTSELRKAKWQEFDIEKKLWVIPPERMKNGEEHVVPLSTQSLTVLRQIQHLTGGREYVFPNQGRGIEPFMSENTMLYSFYRLGYRSRMTGHGVRALASTILNEESSFKWDVIERSLAHVEKNDVRAAYNRATYLKERADLMQWWADYLDAAATKLKIIKFPTKRVAA